MIRLVALDTGVLGLLTHPRPAPESEALSCALWLRALLAQGVRVVLPAVADYELRREYLLRDRTRALEKLDALHEAVEYLSLSDEVLERAAALWAQARKAGRPTADAKALDGDCLIAAAFLLVRDASGWKPEEAVIATMDVGDMPALAPAARWRDITVP